MAQTQKTGGAKGAKSVKGADPDKRIWLQGDGAKDHIRVTGTVELTPDQVVIDRDWNSRQHTMDGELQETAIRALMQDILDKGGLIQPVGVVQGEDGKYHLRYGFRRAEAIKRIHDQGLGVIPLRAEVIEGGDEFRAYLRNVSENNQRQDPTPIDYLHIVTRMKANGMSGVEIANELGMGPSWVSQITKLDVLGDEAKAAIHQGKLGMSLGYDLTGLTPKQREIVWYKIKPAVDHGEITRSLLQTAIATARLETQDKGKGKAGKGSTKSNGGSAAAGTADESRMADAADAASAETEAPRKGGRPSQGGRQAITATALKAKLTSIIDEAGSGYGCYEFLDIAEQEAAGSPVDPVVGACTVVLKFLAGEIGERAFKSRLVDTVLPDDGGLADITRRLAVTNRTPHANATKFADERIAKAMADFKPLEEGTLAKQAEAEAEARKAERKAARMAKIKVARKARGAKGGKAAKGARKVGKKVAAATSEAAPGASVDAKPKAKRGRPRKDASAATTPPTA